MSNRTRAERFLTVATLGYDDTGWGQWRRSERMRKAKRVVDGMVSDRRRRAQHCTTCGEVGHKSPRCPRAAITDSLVAFAAARRDS